MRQLTWNRREVQGFKISKLPMRQLTDLPNAKIKPAFSKLPMRQLTMIYDFDATLTDF